MRLILGTIIFWIIILGIKKFIEDKFKIDNAFTLALAFSAVGIIMYIAGILNMMALTAITLMISSLTYLGYKLHKEKPSIKKLKETIKQPSVFIPIIIFIYITIIGAGMHITLYDNFSHWGLIIKNMFIDNALPNFMDTAIMFKGYQPGSACFIYFYGLLAGKTDGAMIIAQNYLVFVYLIPLFKLIKGNNKVLKNILVTVFYIFTMLVSTKFNDLLVDSLISTMAIASLAIIAFYKKDLKKAFLYSMPITLYVCLVKNTGFLVGIINSVYMLYLAKNKGNIKEGWKYTGLTMLALVLTLLIWQGHTKLAFGDLALNAKHTLSTDNVILSLRTKGWSKIFTLIKAYALHLFTFKNNITNIYILIINGLLLLFAYLEKNKKERKTLLMLTGVIDIIYLAYYGVLGGMYLFSMPWEEAIVFASYERYMTTIVLVIIGIMLLYLINYNEKKHNYKLIVIPSILLMLSTVFLFPSNVRALIGTDDYTGSIVHKYDLLLEDYKDFNTEKQYYIYSPSATGDYGYLFHISRYKFNTGNVEVIYKDEDMDKISAGTIVFFDENKELINKFKDNGWTSKTEYIFEK